MGSHEPETPLLIKVFLALIGLMVVALVIGFAVSQDAGKIVYSIVVFPLLFLALFVGNSEW